MKIIMKKSCTCLSVSNTFNEKTVLVLLLLLKTGVYEGMFDCSDLAQYGVSSSGVYTLLSDDTSHSLSGKAVNCDMQTERGG